MKNIVVHILHTERWTIEELLSSQYLKDVDASIFAKYKYEEVKKEKIGSTILKNKFIKNYYVDERGKPLANHICFNVSHSKGWVALALDESPIGIDIEKIRETEDDMRRYISSDQEYEYIKDDKTFFEIWTNKESLAKCIGDGLNKKIKDIPGLPLNGKKEYLGKNYISECIEYNGYIISVTLEKDDLEEFKILVGDTYI